MPLAYPFAYLVSYELKQPLDRYTKLFTELKSSLKWWHFMEPTWIVVRYEAQVELQSKLLPLIYTTDRLLILPAKGPGNGYLNSEAWTWIKTNIPQEW